MASKKRKLNRKNDESQLKLSQSDTKQLKLTGLPEDVLVEIFSKLNVEELVDVVNASNIFLSSCRRAFRRLYRSHYIELPFLKMNNKIDFQRSVDALRYFGKDIFKLGIDIDQNRTNMALCKRITDLVLVTCHKTLIEIRVCGISTDLKINKIFPNLKTLGICCGHADMSVFQFGKWFPKLENLFLHSICNTATNLNTRRQIPSLQQFSLVGCRHHLDIRKVNNFVQNNPQMKVLSLLYQEDLCLNDDDADTKTYNIVAALDEMMSVQLEPFQFQEYSESLLVQLIIPNERIEHLKLTLEDPCKQMSDFIAKFSNLKILRLQMNLDTDSYEMFKGTKWVQTATHIPLTQLEVCFDVFFFNFNFGDLYVGLEAILPYLQQCQTLNKICVSYRFFGYDEHFFPEFDDEVGKSFDGIKAKIGFYHWSFSQVISSDISFFTLTKTLNAVST